jgi:hypothetical protein
MRENTTVPPARSSNTGPPTNLDSTIQQPVAEPRLNTHTSYSDSHVAELTVVSDANPPDRPPGRSTRGKEHVDADMGGSRSLDRRRSGASFRADAADAIHLAPG